MRRSYRSTRRSSQRRRLAWADSSWSFTLLDTGATLAQDLLMNWKAAGGSVAGCTVMRIIVEQFPRVAVGAQTENGTVRTGIYVDSVLAPLASLDGPVTEPYSDWMINRSDGFNTSTLTDPVWMDQVNSSQYQVRSKRKIGDVGRTLWFISQIENATSGTNLTVAYHSRVLLALP